MPRAANKVPFTSVSELNCPAIWPFSDSETRLVSTLSAMRDTRHKAPEPKVASVAVKYNADPDAPPTAIESALSVRV